MRKEKAELAKKNILTREFLSHSPSHAVRVFYPLFFLNCHWILSQGLKISRGAAALDMFTAHNKLRGHISIFSFTLSFWLHEAALPCRGIPLLPAPLSPAPRCMSSALPFGDETCSHFSHPAPAGVFPWYTSSTALIWGFLCSLIFLLKKIYTLCCPLRTRGHEAVALPGAEMQRNCASLCRKIEEHMQKKAG